MCSVVTRRKAVGGKESCLTLHNMSILASSGIYVNQVLDHFELFFSLYRYLQVSTKVCTTGGVATFSTKPVSVFFLSRLLSPYISLSSIVSLPLPR